MGRFLKCTIVFLCILILMTVNPLKVKSSVPEEAAIKFCIANFFESYFKAYENYDNSNAVNMARGNESLYLFQRAHEIEVKYLKEFNFGYKEIKYDIEYTNISIDRSQASVETTADMCFSYDKLKKIESGIYNVNYKFKLIKDSGVWKIQEVETDYEKYRAFMEDVNEAQLKAYQQGYRSGLSKCQAADRAFNIHLDYIYKSKVEKSSKTKGVHGKETNLKEKKLDNERELNSASYHVENGVEYALRFAEAPVADRFFYTTESDCTNFVSQCVWAGYGGYVKDNALQVEKNIRRKLGMTAQWFGNSGGGTPPWESVDRFCLYMKSSKAKVYNENSLVIEVDPNDIKVGDVLQFRRNASGPYTHSVYVTENLGTGEFSGIFVCQHSTDWKNRNLEDLILSPGWGGYDRCYMKHLSFSGSNNSRVINNNKKLASSSDRTMDVSERDIDEGKKVVMKFYEAINNRDYIGYMGTLGSYRKMRNDKDFNEFVENKKRFKVKEIKFPGRFHDIKDSPHSYEKVYDKKPYKWMYIYVVVEEVGLGRDEEMDFILIMEGENSSWKIHDVGV